MPSVLPSQKPVFHFGLALNRGTLRLPPLCLWRKLLPKGIKCRWHVLPEAREWGEEEKTSHNSCRQGLGIEKPVSVRTQPPQAEAACRTEAEGI